VLADHELAREGGERPRHLSRAALIAALGGIVTAYVLLHVSVRRSPGWSRSASAGSTSSFSTNGTSTALRFLFVRPASGGGAGSTEQGETGAGLDGLAPDGIAARDRFGPCRCARSRCRPAISTNYAFRPYSFGVVILCRGTSPCGPVGKGRRRMNTSFPILTVPDLPAARFGVALHPLQSGPRFPRADGIERHAGSRFWTSLGVTFVVSLFHSALVRTRRRRRVPVRGGLRRMLPTFNIAYHMGVDGISLFFSLSVDAGWTVLVHPCSWQAHQCPRPAKVHDRVPWGSKDR